MEEKTNVADKKYYWLKLKRDFFKRQDIRIIEDMPNGRDYVLFYLKLLVESLEANGELRFNDTIPYNESMLATITNTNIDIVRTAMEVFIRLKLVDILDDKTIFMSELTKLVGAETYWAERKRIARDKKPLALAEQNPIGQFPIMSNECPTDVQAVQVRDKSLEIRDKKKEKDKKKKAESSESVIFEMINSYSDNKEITELLQSYYEMRVSKKKEPSVGAMKLVFKELDPHDDTTKAEMIKRSIVNGWTAIYKIDDLATRIRPVQATHNAVPQTVNHVQRKYDDAFYDSLYTNVRKKANGTEIQN